MSQAVALSEQGNWTAAAVEWRRGADRASLLNDRAGEAIALHNLAQAQRQLSQFDSARTNALAAAELNERLGRKNEWWHNQILLLQIESVTTNHSLAQRFKDLEPRLPEISEPSSRAAFLNELGLWQHKEKQFDSGGESFTRAQQEYAAARDDYGVATVIANRARLLHEQGQHQLALRAWDDALGRFEKIANPLGIAHSLAGKGRTLLAMKTDLPLAEDVLRRAARNFRTLNLLEDSRRASTDLIEALRLQNKEQEAESLSRELDR